MVDSRYCIWAYIYTPLRLLLERTGTQRARQCQRRIATDRPILHQYLDCRLTLAAPPVRLAATADSPAHRAPAGRGIHI